MKYIKHVNQSITKARLHAISAVPSYNVKIYDYGSEQQIRVYSEPVKNGQKKPVKKSIKSISLEQLKIDIEKSFESSDIVKTQYLINEFNSRNEKSLKSSASRSKNTVYEYARANDWDYFFTLTFDPQKIDSTNYEVVVDKLSQWIKNTKRRKAPDLQYIIVPELHKDGKKYHFHGLMKDIGEIVLSDSGKRDKMKRVIYNLGDYRLGFTTVTKIHNPKKASNYISKYITKTLCDATKGKKRYWVSSNVKKPHTSQLLLNDEDVKKLLISAKDQVVYQNSVDVPDTNLHIDYYELRISDDLQKNN